MTAGDLFKPVAGAVAGTLAGGLFAWTASALTFAGELRALTHAVQRIETRLDNFSKPAAAPAPKP